VTGTDVYGPAAPVTGGSPSAAGIEVIGAPVREPLLLPERAVPARPRRTDRTAVARPGRWILALTVLGLAVRLAFINAQSLWLDETLSLDQAGRPLLDMWRFQYTSNVHVPLYHTLLHFWIGVFGTGAVSLRLFSVLPGAACVPLLAVVVRRMFDDRVAVVAAALGAMAPFWVWHSDEGRMYPLTLFLGLASLVLLFAALDRSSFGRWAAYAAVTAVGFYAHYFLLLMPPVHLAWIVLQRPGARPVRAWMASITVAGLAFLPWILLLVTQRLTAAGAAPFSNHGQGYVNAMNPFGLVYAVLIFVAVYVVGYHSVAILDLVSAILVGVWPVVSLLAAVRRGRADRRVARNAAFLGVWLVTQVLVVLIIDHFQPGMTQKYIIMASVPTLALVALGIDRLGRRVGPVVLVALVVLGGLTIAQNVEPDNPVRQDWAGAAAGVRARYRPGDIVAVLPSFNSNALEYYWDGFTPVYGLLNHSWDVDRTLDHDIPELARAHPGATLWVVTSHAEGFDPHGRVVEGLRTQFARTAYEEFTTELYVEGFRLIPRAPGDGGRPPPGG
jgi:mannosyltransferase